ncbi:MAG: hypothetical protein Q8P64_16185, partial [Deltaproteobacteria bacterium]|nr:hypothetical protein [Deltaproteobacteria bacterium]
MLQYRTRAGVLPNPCNCGLLEKLGLLDDFTLGAFPVLPKNACSQLPKVPLQGFGKIPAALCGDFPAKPPSTPARFRYRFFGTGEKILSINRNRVVW